MELVWSNRAQNICSIHARTLKKTEKIPLVPEQKFCTESLVTNVRIKRNAEAINFVPGAQAKQKQTRIFASISPVSTVARKYMHNITLTHNSNDL